MGEDPFQGAFGPFDPRGLGNVPAFREFAKLLSWRGGPVNWDLARQMAQGVAGEPQLAIGVDADEEAWKDAVRVAESWLDEHTSLPAVEGPARAYTAAEWVTEVTSSEGLGRYVEPVANGMQSALGKGLPEGMTAFAGIADALKPVGAMLTGMQMGTIAGHLSEQLLGAYDLGVPTTDPRVVATVGDAAARFARDYDFDPTELRFWLALRECVLRRVFVNVGWLLDHLTNLVGSFAEAADFDPERLMEQLGGMVPPDALGDPEKLQELMGQAGHLELEPSPEQQRILARIQAVVSLVAGYADSVVGRAAHGRLPNLARIEEATTRRRAQHGPGEQFLAQLVGLDLKPADVRQGKAFCDAVVAARGQEGLDHVWDDPAMLPTSEELAEPSRWLVRLAARDVAEGRDTALPEIDFEVPDDLGELDEG